MRSVLATIRFEAPYTYCVCSDANAVGLTVNGTER